MRKLFLFSLALIAVAASAALGEVPPGEETLLWYMGNLPPDTVNSAGPGLRFVRYPGSVRLGSLVYDNDASDKVAWRINDTGGTSEWWRMDPQRTIDHSVGATVVARLKVASDTHVVGAEPSINIGIGDCGKYGTNSLCESHWGGPNGDIVEVKQNESVSVTGDANYHILRLTMRGRLTIDFSTFYPAHKDENWSDDMEAYAQYAPLVGQDEWTGVDDYGGMTIVPDPFQYPSDPHGNVVEYRTAGQQMTAIQYVGVAPDASGKMEFIFDIHAGEGTGFAWKVHVNDVFGINIAQWYGYPDNCVPRIAGSSNIGTAVSLFKVGPPPDNEIIYEWYTLKIVINTNTHMAHIDVYDSAGVEVKESGVGLPRQGRLGGPN